MNTLFLDFDGVLFNSVKEAYILSNHVYAGADLFAPVNEEEFKIFSDNRYLIHDSWHYYYIIKLLKEGVTDMKDAYPQLLQHRDTEKDTAFNKAFVQARKDLINQHYDFWINLDTPYPFLHEVKRIHDNALLDVVMVSSKNVLAVDTSLKKYGIELDASKIFGKEDLYNFNNKGHFLREYIAKHGITKSFFVEDSQENLDKCANIPGLTPLLVSWGYISPEQKGLTEQEILAIVGA